MNLEAIAKQIKEQKENIILIYAFNAIGKTRLSVAYKDITKDPKTGQHAGVYYNAFSEDLFVWDNDEENDGANINLRVLRSSLNQFHSFLYENEDAVTEKLERYMPNYVFRFNAHENPEDGIESVSFYLKPGDASPIKISRGEERIFVWCFFLALLEVDGWANKQDAHIFIDDPVSSLDEHNIYVTADSIFQQIEQHFLKKKIIVTTHHIGLFSILANRLKSGAKKDRYENNTEHYILNRVDDNYSLGSHNKSVFLFHLHLLRILRDASKEKLYAHHMLMLRQVLENIASFLGTKSFSFTLEQIGVDNVEYTAEMINSLSHKNAYHYQSNLMAPPVEKVFRDVLKRLLEKYQFALH
jgi:hypothetical protein